MSGLEKAAAMTPWPNPPTRLSRADLLRIDSLVVLARNVRAGLDDSFGERAHDALGALDDLVQLAATLRPAIAARVPAPQQLLEKN